MSSPQLDNFKPDQATVQAITQGLSKIRYGQFQIKKSINQAPTQYKMIIILIGIVILVILFYFLIYKKPLTLTHTTILKGLMKSPPKPFNAKTNKGFIYKDPVNNDETPYVPSNVLDIENQQQYTISFWIYPRGSHIKQPENTGDWSYKYGQWKHILHVGDWNNGKADNQSPGFWLSPETNRLNIMIDTTQEKERIILDNLNLNSWTNITVTVNNFSVSVYSNGRLEKTITLRYAPVRIFNQKMYVCENGGYAGYLAFIEAYSTPLEPDAVYNIYKYFLPWMEIWYEYSMNSRVIPKPIPFTPMPPSPSGPIPPSETGCIHTPFKCCPDGITPKKSNEDTCSSSPPSKKDCTDTKFGCCPDGITPKKSSDGSNCTSPSPSGPNPPSETGCQYSSFGCCPDGIKPKNFKGDPCSSSPTNICN